MLILALDAALARCSAALADDEVLVAEQVFDAAQGHAAALPPMVQAVLARAGVPPSNLGLIAVTIGPGSFTGVRAALSLAHGLGLASGVPVAGVTVGEALAAQVGPLKGRALWVAIDSKRGRVFLERDGFAAAVALDALPEAHGPLAIAGDAAGAVASRLAARGLDVVLTDARLPLASGVAAAAYGRAMSGQEPRKAEPLYVDAPQVKLPARPPRAPPAVG